MGPTGGAREGKKKKSLPKKRKKKGGGVPAKRSRTRSFATILSVPYPSGGDRQERREGREEKKTLRKKKEKEWGGRAWHMMNLSLQRPSPSNLSSPIRHMTRIRLAHEEKRERRKKKKERM